jgi:acyl transferase domain-containing protein
MPSTTLEPYDSMSIAVIGLACRLPGDASNAEMFWDMLCDGRCKSAINHISWYKID